MAKGAPSKKQVLAAAEIATSQWGIEAESIDILSESENVVCDVRLRGGRHRVMRLHRPGYNSIQELRSEVAWVETLAAGGLPVPKQLPALDGQHYVAVKVGRQERFVGVIEWLNGSALGGPLEAADDRILGQYAKIGELAAKIRSQSADWVPPEDFVRRRWDADGLVGKDPIWGRFWEVGTLTAAQRKLFTSAREQLHEELSAISTEPDRFGMIHADLHLGNVMAHGDDLTIIDFDDAGFGWYAHEIAVALHSTLGEPNFESAKTAMVSGYRRAHRLDDDEVRLIDTFLVVRCLMIVGWLNDRPELAVHSLLPEVTKQAADVTKNYLARGAI